MQKQRSVQRIAEQSVSATIVAWRVQGLWLWERQVLAAAESPRELGALA